MTITQAELDAIRARARKAPMYDERYLKSVTDDYASDFYKHARQDVSKLLAEVALLRKIISRLGCDECLENLGDTWVGIGGKAYCYCCAGGEIE